MKLNIFLLISLLITFPVFAEEEPAPAPEPENIVLTNYHAAPYGDYDELQADYASFGSMIIGEVDIDGDNDFDKDDMRVMELGDVAASGITDVRGGLVIETRTNDPASPVPGQLWLRMDVTPAGGGGSSMIWDAFSHWGMAYSITSDNDYIYVAGYDSSLGNGNLQWRIEKLSKIDGLSPWPQAITSNLTSLNDIAYSITSDNDYIYITGSRGTFDWYTEKRGKSTGELIWSKPSPGVGGARSITSDSEYIYIAGASSYAWRIEKRNKSDGELTWPQQAIISDPSSSMDTALSITSDSDYIYIAGFDGGLGNSNSQWRIEKRNKSDGILAWHATSSNFSIDNHIAYSITSDDDYIFVVGFDTYSGGSGRWRIEKRNKSDGELVWPQKAIISDPASGSDIAYSVTSDNDYIYIAGFGSVGGYYQWRIEKRRKSDGGLAGTVISDPSSLSDIAYSVISDNDYIYVAGYDSSHGLLNPQWRIEKYSKCNFIDIGLCLRTGTETVTIACEPEDAVTSSLRIARNNKTYGIVLVDTSDSNATNIRIKTASGVKALRKL